MYLVYRSVLELRFILQIYSCPPSFRHHAPLLDHRLFARNLELTRQLVNSEDKVTIFASSRSSNNPKFQELLQQRPERIIHVPLDVTD
jgi:hypothetical protein